MELFIAAFAAGILTVLAPCILPLLPVVLGSSLVASKNEPVNKRWQKPLVITISLGLSVILFTLLLKVSTSLLGVPTELWSILSGVIIVLLGASMAFPAMWEHLSLKFSIGSKTQKLLGASSKFHGYGRDAATGFALGPVFNSCSPTYLFIVAVALPASFINGLGLLISYVVGLCGTLLVIAFLGQSATARLSSISDPRSMFKRGIGLILLIVGVILLFGIDKSIQSYVIDQGWYAPISNLEMKLE
jgi:cytochrome c-type biogenesis protein